MVLKFNIYFFFVAFGAMEAHYVIHFNSRDAYKEDEKSKGSSKNNQDESAEGPVVERKCPKCGNDKMSYATLQLRSADEGQTVFFTCTKCK